MASTAENPPKAQVTPNKSKESVFSLENLPSELFLKIIKEVVLSFGLRKAVKLCKVSRLFYESITEELCYDFITCPNGVVEAGICLAKNLHYPSHNEASHRYATPHRLIDIGRSLAGRLLLSLMEHDSKHKILTPVRQALRSSQTYDEEISESEYRNKYSAVFESLSESLCWKGDQDPAGRRQISIINSPDFDATDTDFMRKEQFQINLSVAIITNNISKATELIKSGAVDLNSGNTLFEKPLSISVQHKRTNIIKLLLKNGATWLDNDDLWSLKPTAIPALIDLHVKGEISLASEPGISALNLSNHQIDIIAFDSVASINTNTFSILMDLTRKRNFPLHMYDRLLIKAIKYGNEAVMKWVLDHGAETFKDPGDDSTNIHSKYRVSPLRAAAKSGQSKIVRMLLDHGERDTAPGGFANSTALGLAASFGYEDIVEMLLDNDVENSSKLSFINIQPGEHPHILRLLLERGFSLDESARRSWITSMGDVFLRDAIKSGNLCMVQELVKQGVAVNFDDPEKSPVLYALKEGRKEILSFLKLSGGKEIHPLATSSADMFNNGDMPRRQEKTESELFVTLGRY